VLGSASSEAARLGPGEASGHWERRGPPDRRRTDMTPSANTAATQDGGPSRIWRRHQELDACRAQLAVGQSSSRDGGRGAAVDAAASARAADAIDFSAQTFSKWLGPRANQDGTEWRTRSARQRTREASATRRLQAIAARAHDLSPDFAPLRAKIVSCSSRSWAPTDV
jgi:hypothetical protein